MPRFGVAVESSTSRKNNQVTYWAYLREPNDYAYLMAVGRIFFDAFQVPDDKRLELYNRVRARFTLMVDVKQLKEKH